MRILNKPHDQFLHYKHILDDNDYWLEFIFHAHETTTLVENIPKFIIESIKNKKLFLLLSNEFECFSDVPYAIYENLIIKQDIPESQIVFLSGARDIKKIVEKIKDEINTLHNTDFQGIKSIFFPWFEFFTSKNCKKIKNNIITKRKFLLNGKLDYKKHYLCLNRRWRHHRPTLVALLNNKNLLDKGYVSLGSNDQTHDWNTIYDELLHYNKKDSYITSILENDKEKNLNLGYLTLDSEDFEHKRPNLVSTLDPYYQSFMSVVTETYFYDFDTLFITEKTFRPIAYLQPFIIVSIPNTLGFIRELGYKTFHPYIDERYDLEHDDGKRMLMIVNEIERICRLSQKELRELSLQVKDICYHNYNLLLSKI
jgi:hypothetical protein